MFCHKCGNKLPEESNFCSKCGNKQEASSDVTRKDESPARSTTTHKGTSPSFSVGETVYAKWKDGSYYKCRILNITDKVVKVKYVEDGIVTEVKISNIAREDSINLDYDVEEFAETVTRQINVQHMRGLPTGIIFIAGILTWIFIGTGIVFYGLVGLLIANFYFTLKEGWGVVLSDKDRLANLKQHFVVSIVNVAAIVLFVLFSNLSLWFLLVCIPDAYIIFQAKRSIDLMGGF